MAITRVGVMANPPTNIGDYTHILAHLDAYAKQVGNQGMLLTQWGNASGVPAIAKGSYISHGGTLFVVDTEDYALTEPAGDGTYYLKVAANGDTLVLSWVASTSGYTWNAIYNGLYDGSENQILPYQLEVSGTVTVFSKRKITNLMQGAGFVTVDYLGAIVGTTINTGQGANELYPMNQAVRTTDSPTFSALGFASLNPGNSTETTVQVSAGDSQVLPKGAYTIIMNPSIECQIKHGSYWFSIFTSGGFVISDGVNFRLHNNSGETSTTRIRKW